LTGAASQAASTVQLGSSGLLANFGSSVTFTATVASTTTGVPTGSVNFYDGVTLLNATPIRVSASGVASYSTATLGLGTNNITAQYSGDANFTGSTSPTVVETVEQLVVTIGSQLSSLILDPTANVQQYVAEVSLSNGGNIGSNIQVTGASLNGVSSTSLPISQTVAPSGSSKITLNFPVSAGAAGARAVLTVSGTYSAPVAGGSSLHGSWTGSFRVTLPASSQ
jgi:hypothetical protein